MSPQLARFGRYLRATALASIVPIALAGCSPGGDTRAVASDTGRTSTTIFSAREREAARALSIGSTLTLDPKATPLERAILCAASTTALRTRFDESPLVSAQQRKLLRRAEIQFIDNARKAGAASNLSAAEIDKRMTGMRETTEMSVLLRSSLACLRNLDVKFLG